MYEEIADKLDLIYKFGKELCRVIVARAVSLAKQALLNASYALILTLAQGLALQELLGL